MAEIKKLTKKDYFKELNISNDDGIILLDYFEALALIGIEYLNNNI